jgi:YggT family protein
MNGLCNVYGIVHYILEGYILVMLAYALVSWVPGLRGPWYKYVAMLVEPVLVPVRRVIPPMGGLDLSFMAIWIVILLIDRNIVVPNSICYY